MKTKEEILEQEGFDFDAFQYENEFSAKAILKAMESYASQSVNQYREALAFAEWIAVTSWCWSGSFGWHNDNYQEGTCITTQQLYQLFKEEKPKS